MKRRSLFKRALALVAAPKLLEHVPAKLPAVVPEVAADATWAGISEAGQAVFMGVPGIDGSRFLIRNLIDHSFEAEMNLGRVVHYSPTPR